MVFINRLASGVGEEKDYYIPKNSQVLVKTSAFSLSNDEISPEIKAHGIRMLFNPNAYHLKRENEKIVLKDISEHSVELPTTLATFKPENAVPEIVINGYLLYTDQDLLSSLSEEEKKEVSQIIKHFEEIKSRNPLKSVRHELKHWENALFFEELHQNNECLSSPLYLENRYFDEISASCDENFGAKEISHKQAEQIIFETIKSWNESPYKKPVYKGDFERHASKYEEKTQGMDSGNAKAMLNKIVKKYFTFNIDGKETDLSYVVMPQTEQKQQRVSSLPQGYPQVVQRSR